MALSELHSCHEDSSRDDHVDASSNQRKDLISRPVATLGVQDSGAVPSLSQGYFKHKVHIGGWRASGSRNS